jgi:ribosomal protein S18 acetylase RimI-like enzyme
MASSTGSLPPPSPSPLAQAYEIEDSQALEPRADPLANIPPLTTTRVTSQDDKVDALHIIADTVAQQRQIASKAIILHPGVISVMVLVLGVIYSYLYKGATSDLAIVGTTSAGVLMAFLISIRYFAGGYIEEAEKVGTWKWLDKGRDSEEAIGDEDEIILSRFGDEAIGAIVMRGVREAGTPNGSGSPRKRRQNSSGKNAPMIGKIRGFSVKNRLRRRGVGTELLEEAIRICQEKGWQGPEFATDHANSARILVKQFNGPFDKLEKNAQAMLEKVREEAGVGVSTRKGKR